MTTIVVVAAVVEENGQFLVTRRPAGVPLAGYWEFPGGKCEAGETHAQSLLRELREELGVDVTIGDELLTTSHDYADRRVELHFFTCRLLGTPAPQIGQDMQWVPRTELARLAFPPADDELIRRLTG